MTHRERFRQTMRFGSFDRPPLWEYGAWPQTIHHWRQEGMADDLQWPNHKSHYAIEPRAEVGFCVDMIPAFEEVILEEDERYQVIRHTDGQVTRALKEGTMEGIRTCMDQYLDAPVRDHSDFAALKARYRADSPERLPADWPARALELQTSDLPRSLYGKGAYFGLYMQLRAWMGTERLSYALHDDPALIHEMLEFLTDFVLRVIEPIMTAVQFDFFCFDEDFAGRSGPLFSPGHFREFFAPRYRRIIERCRPAGIQWFYLDSDGNFEVLIPQMLETGINWITPCEAAAGMDPVKLRREYGRDLIISGGLDKRAVAKGPIAIEEELQRKIPALVQQGGYIPHLDHLFSHDISYANLIYYLDLKARLLNAYAG